MTSFTVIPSPHQDASINQDGGNFWNFKNLKTVITFDQKQKFSLMRVIFYDK